MKKFKNTWLANRIKRPETGPIAKMVTKRITNIAQNSVVLKFIIEFFRQNLLVTSLKRQNKTLISHLLKSIKLKIFM